MKKITVMLSAIVTITFLSSCTDYGKKVKSGHIEAYYKDGVTEMQAQRTADLLYKMDVSAGNKANEKSFQLGKDHDSLYLKMVVPDPKSAGVNDFNFLAIADYISDSTFNGAPVNMELSDQYFKSFKVIHYKKLTEEDLKQAE